MSAKDKQAVKKQKYSDSKYKAGRRTFLKASALATGATAGGVSVTHPDSPASVVGDAEGVVISGTVLVGAAAIAVGTGVAAKTGYDWYTSDDVPDRETATASQTHRDIYDITRGLDSASDEEEDIETLITENLNNRVWGEAAADFAEGYNTSEKSVSELQSEFVQYIQDEYSEVAKEIIGNWNTDMQTLVDLFSRIENYGVSGSVDQMLELQYQDDYSGANTATVSFVEGGWSTSNASGNLPMVDPFADGVVTQDDIQYADYELPNTETVEMANWYNEYLDPVNNSQTVKSGDNAGESITAPVGDFLGLEQVNILAPTDAESVHTICHFQRRLQLLNTIKNESQKLVGEISSFVDGITSQYARGNLPVQEITDFGTLVDEYGYEDGNAGLMAMYLGGSGVDTNLNSPVTVKHYGTNTTVSDVNDDTVDNPEATEYQGYLSADSPPTDGFSTGTVYDGGSIGASIVTQAGMADLGVFEITEVKNYDTSNASSENIKTDEDGDEYVTQDQFEQQQYNFQSRDPNQYKQDIEANQDVREEATSVDPADKGGGGGGLVSVNFDGSNPLLYAIPGVGIILALLFGASKAD